MQTKIVIRAEVKEIMSEAAFIAAGRRGMLPALPGYEIIVKDGSGLNVLYVRDSYDAAVALAQNLATDYADAIIVVE